MSTASDLHPALAFYLENWDDMAALAELDEAPKGVRPEDWHKFQAVLDAASSAAADLLQLVSEEATEVLRGPLTYRNKSRRSYLKEYWSVRGTISVGRRKKAATLCAFLTREKGDSSRTLLVLTLWFNSESRRRAAAYIQSVSKTPYKTPCHAEDHVDFAEGPSTVLLDRWPLDGQTRTDDVIGKVRAALRAFLNSSREFASVLQN